MCITLSLGIYFSRIQQSFRTERSGSGTARRRTGTGREENKMKKIPRIQYFFRVEDKLWNKNNRVRTRFKVAEERSLKKYLSNLELI